MDAEAAGFCGIPVCVSVRGQLILFLSHSKKCGELLVTLSQLLKKCKAQF